MQTIRGAQPAAWDTERIMARRKVLFRGHPVAAICAADIHIAEDAINLIEVEYEVLPAVTTIEDDLEFMESYAVFQNIGNSNNYSIWHCKLSWCSKSEFL